MNTLSQFIARQNSLTPSSFTRVNLLNGQQVTPVRLLDELRTLGRNVQFISLDQLRTEAMFTLPKVLDDFLATGFDVVLTVQSRDVLDKYIPVLVDWKFNREEKKQVEHGGLKAGVLYLLPEDISSSVYPTDLQHLVDFEYQINDFKKNI